MSLFAWGLIACFLSIIVGFQLGSMWQEMICNESDKQVKEIYKKMIKDIERKYEERYNSLVDDVLSRNE